MRGKASSATSCRCRTDRPHSHRHQVRLQIIDARFSIDVLKSLKLPVMDLFVKSALKTHPTRHRLPSAVVSASRRPLALYWQWTSPPPRRHGTCFIQHPIINLCEHPAGQTGTAAHQPAASCPICPSLTWPRPQSFQPHIYNSWRSSGFALTPLPAPIKKCRGIKPFGANISSCSESQWLSPGLHPSHGRGEACRDITQIFLKLSTSRSHKLRANHRRRHRTRRMYAPP